MKNITMILGSGVALGVYVPPLLLEQELKSKYLVEFEVIESLFLDSKLEKIIFNKKIFHNNSRIAVKAHQKTIEYSDCYDLQKIKMLFTLWEEKEIKHFIVFSGLWMFILKKYEEYIGKKINIECVHMDSIVSNSWKNYIEEVFTKKNLWFFSEEYKNVNCYIGLEKKYPVNIFDNRKKCITLHGGGWGMGTYKSKIKELMHQDIKLNCILYFYEEVEDMCACNDYFILDEKWIPWNKTESGYSFPPMLKLNYIDKKFEPISTDKKHGFYSILNNSLGVVSKPGGGTLLDSIETETPVIFLEPVGPYEKNNAELWIKLGFGFEYEVWKNHEFSFDILKQANEKIRECKKDLKRIEELLCSLKQM